VGAGEAGVIKTRHEHASVFKQEYAKVGTASGSISKKIDEIFPI
jgi:hypothetical protein